MKKISLLSILLIGALLIPACTTKKENQAEKPKKEISLQLYSLRDDIRADYAAIIDSVAAMGYTGIEAAGYKDGLFYEMAPADFKKSIEDRGLVVLSSHTTKPLAENPQETNWEETWAWWDTAIQAHKDAGMRYIVAPWMPMPKTLADLQAYCDYYNQIGERCNTAGMRFGYHNHNFEFQEVEGELMFDYLLKNTDPAKVFFQMDVYWVVEGGKEPADYFDAYPGRFELLHIKDELELGKSGKVNFQNIFNNIEKSGAKHLIVEVERYTGTPFEGVRESYEFLANTPYVKDSYSK